MSRSVETIVTFLEMRTPPALQVPRPVNVRLMLTRAEDVTVGFYRFLYDAVGRDYAWVDRKRLADSKLAEIIGAKGVEVWVLYAGGVPAGFFEIDARDPRDIELVYFGLMPEFLGRGLGKWLLREALDACWSHGPERVRVETCTLDGPAALPLYQKLGFVPVARKHKVMELI